MIAGVEVLAVVALGVLSAFTVLGIVLTTYEE